jgi:hypothetical protein
MQHRLKHTTAELKHFQPEQNRHVLQRNSEKRSHNCWWGKAVSITYSEYVFVSLVTQLQIARAVLYCRL